jgi:hypothetical protein
MKYYSCKDPHIKALVALKAITRGILPTRAFSLKRFDGMSPFQGSGYGFEVPRPCGLGYVI